MDEAVARSSFVNTLSNGGETPVERLDDVHRYERLLEQRQLHARTRPIYATEIYPRHMQDPGR